MQTKQKLLNTMVLLACSNISTQAYAALPTNAILNFDAGVVTSSVSGAEFVKAGSYFGMDTSGNGRITANERTAISQNAGLAIGKAQPASGSHGGEPDGTESPGIDKPWGLFGNAGLHWTQTPANIISDDTLGNVVIDLSGWVVAWNFVEKIPMSGGAWLEGFTNGEAKITCGTDCSDGDTYTLDYYATVPADCKCSFENVPYNLHMIGTISVPPPADVSEGTYDGGSIAGSGSDGRITMDDVTTGGFSADTGYTYTGGLFDFVISGVTSGASIAVQFELSAPAPANAVYRKLINSSWVTLTDDANNWVASAPQTGAACPPANDVAYVKGNGITEGDLCLQLTIQDNGIYDADVNLTSIADPGGVAAAEQVFVDTRVSGTDGCSMSGNTISSSQHADWWLVAGFMGLLGLFRLKRNKT